MRIGLDGISQGRSMDEGAGAMGSLLPDLYEALARIAPEHEFVVLATRHAGAFGSLRGPNLRLVQCSVSRFRPLRVAYEQWRVPIRARRLRLDVYYASTNVLPLQLRCPTVLVVNALQCFAFPVEFGGRPADAQRRRATTNMSHVPGSSAISTTSKPARSSSSSSSSGKKYRMA